MKKNKVYVVVSIDTECDKDPKWEIPRPMRFENIFIQNKIFKKLYADHGVKPTYLLSPEILRDDDCVNYFKNFENIELGTHLHEEFIEPEANMDANRTKNIQGDLSYQTEKEKLTNLTNLFIDRFGYQPKSFRAGRFGYSEKTFEILESLGYLVDSSVTPFKTNYFTSGHKTNGWGKPLEPYLCLKNSHLLQVPVTIINRDFLNVPLFIMKYMESKDVSFLKKLVRKMGCTSKPEWLRPFRKDGSELLSIAEFVIEHHFKTQNFAILNIMFHSNEILEGASPYCQSRTEVESFVQSLDFLFASLKEKYELWFIGLGEVYGLYSQR